MLAELTGVYRAEGQGGANESRGSGRSRPIGCLSHDGRWFERAPNTSVIDDADISTAYATYIHACLLPSHAFGLSFSINTYKMFEFTELKRQNNKTLNE